ncbi:hypothetical protein JL722_1221 [Aureococcus anophagefferens]|nr:hypothetical protein JL722_1221 [Aureococcus anophagefferens]
MVDGALARPGGDDAAARRSRQARVEYLCVSLCRCCEASLDDALALVAALALRRLAAAERSAGEGLRPAAAAAGLLRDRPRPHATSDVAAAGAAATRRPAQVRGVGARLRAATRRFGRRRWRRSRAARRTARCAGDLEVTALRAGALLAAVSLLIASSHGFRKTRRRKLSAANGQCGWSEFSHAFFVRNRRDLLCQIKRMEHLSTPSSNGEPAEEQPTKRPRLPSVDDEHAAALSLREMAAPADEAPPATPSGLGRNSHNARPSFGDDARKSLPAIATIRPPPVPRTVNPPDTPADRRFSADIGRAWPATAPWSPDAVVHKPAAPPADFRRVPGRVRGRRRRPSGAGARAAQVRGAPPPAARRHARGPPQERDSFIQELAKTHVAEPPVTPGNTRARWTPSPTRPRPRRSPRAAAPYVPIAPRCVTEPGATHVAAV